MLTAGDVESSHVTDIEKDLALLVSDNYRASLEVRNQACITLNWEVILLKLIERCRDFGSV